MMQGNKMTYNAMLTTEAAAKEEKRRRQYKTEKIYGAEKKHDCITVIV